MLKNKWLLRLSLTAIVFSLIFAVPTLLFNQYLGGNELRADIASFGFIAPAVFIIIAIIANVLPPVAVLPFWIIGVTIFGFPYGYIYIFVANMSASLINYYLARRWGRQILQRLLGKHGLEQVDRIGKLTSPNTILYLRLFGGALADYISYASGLVKIDWRKYFRATIIGCTPMLLFAFYIVHESLNRRLLAVAGLVAAFYLVNYLVSLLLIPVLIKYRSRD